MGVYKGVGNLMSKNRGYMNVCRYWDPHMDTSNFPM